MVSGLFKPLLDQIEACHLPNTEKLKAYLARHIELDGDEHYPKALQMLAKMCGDDQEKWKEAERSAIQSLDARIDFLDGILKAIQKGAVNPHDQSQTMLESSTS